MVRHGKFKLELIRADTSVAFQEHVHRTTSETYAEVEPDTEYFIRVTSNDPRGVLLKPSVDGKPLGYSQTLAVGVDVKLGLWFKNHFKALKFDKLYRRRNKTPNNAQYDGHWTGSVEIEVYERKVLPGYYIQDVFESNWTPNSEDILKGLDLSSNKKACNSSRGATKTEPQKQAQRRSNFACGSKLATIKLNYCSTVGLIAAKVLNPVPEPDISKIPSTVLQESKINTKKRRRTNENLQVKSITMTKTETVQVLDLTDGDEDDETRI